MQKLTNIVIDVYVKAMIAMLSTAALFATVWLLTKAFGLFLSVFGGA